MTNNNLKSLFGEILAGYSIITGDIFYKHYTTFELGIIDIKYQSFIEEAKNKKLPSEEDRKNFLIKTGQWSIKDEQKLKDSKEMLSYLDKQRKNAFLESQIESVKRDIRREEALFSSLYNEKYKLIGLTIEGYANNKLKEIYIRNSLFFDTNFTRKITEEEWESMPINKYNEIKEKHDTVVNNLSKNLRKIALSDFAQNMWSLSNDSTYEFYGTPITKLTVYQIDLCRWIKIFNNIISKYNNIPENLYSEPEALLDWVNSGKNLEDIANKAGEGKNTTIIGATKKDMEKINKGNINQASSFIDKLKQSGKKTLNVNELV